MTVSSLPPKMSPAQRSVSGQKVLLSRGIAIILRKSNPDPKPPRSKKKSKGRKDPPDHNRISEVPEYEYGPEIFASFTRENSECYWNPYLVQSIRNLEYKGFVRPAAMLVGGTEYSLEVIRSAWGRRMLRPPAGYDIVMLGDVDPLTLSLVSQTQFAPLPEALCKVVYDLTSEGITASLQVISKRLKATFPELVVPGEGVLYNALGTLIRERKLYHTGSGYSVVTPDTFRLLAMSPPLERQMLLTNEEAIIRLHGVAYAVDDGRTACTQTKDTLTAWSSAERILEPRKQQAGISAGKLKRCHSLKLLRGRDKDKLSRSNSLKSNGTSPGPIRSETENDPLKKEKTSMFSKWFRRGRTDKTRASKSLKDTFSSSTQFPPRDWSDPDFVHFNSRATQTLDRNQDFDVRSKIRSSSLTRTMGKDRHSMHLSSTPATPHVSHRNVHRNQASDIYHYRSSSLPRKASPSPKRRPEENTPPKVVSGAHRLPPRPPDAGGQEAKQKLRYESPFSPVTSRRNTPSLLTAGQKYSDLNSSFPAVQTCNNTLSYRPTSASTSTIPSPTKTPTFNSALDKPIETSLLGWRRPTSLTPRLTQPKVGIGEPIKQPSVVVIPRVSTPREVVNPTPTKATVVDDKATSKNTTNVKEVRIDGTVDVEISMMAPQLKKTLLTTDLDTPVKSDLLKIATTWNQSIRSNNPPAKTLETVTKPFTGIPKLTTTTNITTSLTHGPLKDTQKVIKTVETLAPKIQPVGGTVSPVKETVKGSPRIAKASDAKAEFLSASPNTTEVHSSKDDSGFSSSASTSRPMSVSPC